MRWLRQRIEEDRGLALAIGLHSLVQLLLALWDLPGAHGWENDGIAPRDLFGGLANNLSPGRAHRYPLLHYVLVGLLSAPVLGAAALSTSGWARADLEAVVLSVPVMTGIALAAKLLAVGMGAVTLLCLARIGRRLFSARAGRLGVLFAITNLSVVYYGRTSNLDGPYLMWVLLALDRILDVFEHGHVRDYRILGVLVAAAVATKDQAYAAFVLVVPLYLVMIPLVRAEWVAAGRAHFRYLFQTGLFALCGYAILAGPLWNPTGFFTRVALITGPNNEDWQVYSKDLVGLSANVRDLLFAQAQFFWSWPLVLLAWLGVARAALRLAPDMRTRLLRHLPSCAGLSTIFFFALLVRRCEHRFLLPLGTLLSVYGGVLLDELGDWLLQRPCLAHRARTLHAAALALVALLGLRHPVALALTQWNDVRKDAERIIARFVAERPTETVELYGPLVYLPRIDPDTPPTQILRVGPEPLRGRNPLAGATELQAAYSDMLVRKPGLVVVTGGFVERFFPDTQTPGRVAPRVFANAHDDPNTQAWLRAILADRLPGYRRVAEPTPQLPGWARRLGLAPVRVHGSVGQAVYVLERE